jgi:hypothetical protein
MLDYLTSSAAEGEAEASFWYAHDPAHALSLPRANLEVVSLGDIYYNGSDAIEVDYPKALQFYREVICTRAHVRKCEPRSNYNSRKHSGGTQGSHERHVLRGKLILNVRLSLHNQPLIITDDAGRDALPRPRH